MMRRIKIAQIGAGHDHAADAVTTLKRQNDIFELMGYAVVPEDSGNVGAFSYEGHKTAYDGVKRMTVEEILNCSELDAVCIETEDRALTKYAYMAAEKGLHIHMDKPGGIDGAEFERLIDLAEQNGKVFHVGYMYRYNPAVLKLKSDIAAGKLGEVYAVEAQMNCLHGVEKREWLADYPGGMLYFLGCHMIDLIYSIMGEPEAVIPLGAASGIDGVTAEDFGMAAFKYKNGTSFAKSTAVEVGGGGRRQVVVCGSKGTVEIRPLEIPQNDRTDIFVPLKVGVREVLSGGEKNLETEVYGRYDAMYRAFAEYVRGEKTNPFGYEYERGLHRLLLKACGS